MLSTHIGIRQNALLPLISALILQRQKETNEQVRIASVITDWCNKFIYNLCSKE